LKISISLGSVASSDSVKVRWHTS